MQLTRERIVGAAIDLIEREGADAVSMRRIAAELGSGAMSLYNHVPSKSALLDAVAEQVMSEIDFSSEPGASWQEQVRAQARAFRQIARTYPRCTLVVVSRHSTWATGLRPMEHALATLRGAGFGGMEAVRIVHAFVAYIVGSLLREVGVSPSLASTPRDGEDEHGGNGDGDGDSSGGGGPAADRHDRLSPDDFPQVLSLSSELLQQDPEADFEFGLDLLVQAIGALLAAAQPSGH